MSLTNDAMNKSQQQQSSSPLTTTSRPFVRIVEQPASKALRFRYECEGRSAGSIPGRNSTPENKTFPTIEIVDYKGRAVVVVSCVTKDPPYRPHPHNLVGREGSCKYGVCTMEINSETMRAVFSNLGIQCVKKKDISKALSEREKIRVDPFRTGFQYQQTSSIDLNSVRLCFQVFLEDKKKGKCVLPLPPVVSDPIYDKKAMSDLVICTLCSCSSTVAGGKYIILLCEKVTREDISVRFFEEQNGQITWEAYGDFQPTDVHRQTAIKFKTPKYKTLDIDEPVKVNIQLRRPSDGTTSEPLPFDYLPLNSDPDVLKRKRQRLGNDQSLHLLRQFTVQDQTNQGMDDNFGFLNMTQTPTIKSEPRDASPIPYNIFGDNTMTYRMQENSLSPHSVSPNHQQQQQQQQQYTPSNTPSPFNITTIGGSLMPPNNIQQQQQQQYAVQIGNISPNMQMDIAENYQLQHQQQQQQQQQFGFQNQLTSWNFNMNNPLGTQIDGIQSHNTEIPSTSTQNWNLVSDGTTIAAASIINNNINTNNLNMSQILANVQIQNQLQSSETVPNLSSLLDMDSEQLIQVNSKELSGLSLS